MVLTFVVVYVVITIVIGLAASRLVKGSKDFIVAGRSLPLYMSATALFATWFGAETMLGASSRVNAEGMMGIIEDPLGASLCLFLIGAFFARPLYRSNLYTFGDFFRKRYDRRAEMISSVFIVVSYFGWVAAQIVALGIIFSMVAGVDPWVGMLLGSGLVVSYTFFGGMWAVSITDFLQMILIIVSLVVVFIVLADQAGGVGAVLGDRPDWFYRPFPHEHSVQDWGEYLTAWMTIGLGSLPQQDLFQRICSAKSEKVAVRAAYLGGFMYLTVAFLPLFIALSVRNLAPELLAMEDHQLILPTLIAEFTPPWVQIFFYGALLSAILSTASAAILAPSVILSENLVKPMLPKLTDRQFLWLTRACVLVIAGVSISLALPQGGAEAGVEEGGLPSIFELVAESYTSTLVALLVPLTAGIYWKRATPRAAFAAMALGITVWALFRYGLEDLSWGAKLAGFGASIVAMVVVTLWFPGPQGHERVEGIPAG